MDPGRSSPVVNYSADTLKELISVLERSSELEQCIYREAELDDLIRQVEADLQADPHAAGAEHLRRLLGAALEAHGLVANQQPLEAAGRLRAVL